MRALVSCPLTRKVMRSLSVSVPAVGSFWIAFATETENCLTECIPDTSFAGNIDSVQVGGRLCLYPLETAKSTDSPKQPRRPGAPTLGRLLDPRGVREPRAQSPSPEILFFSRGRGRGHAVPDMAILDQFRRLSSEADVRFVSYGTGAATLRQAEHSVIDLALPDDARFLDVLVRASRVIHRLKPRFVFAHEEFAALPAAKTFGVPTLLLVDFFRPVDIWLESLRFADRVVFLERRGLFPEPPQAKGRVRYVGPVVRPLAYALDDRAEH